MDDNALLAELERNLESEYGSDTQSVDSLSEIHGLRSSSTNSPANQSAESSVSSRSKRNSIEDLFSSEKVLIHGPNVLKSILFTYLKTSHRNFALFYILCMTRLINNFSTQTDV
jgi:stalled ribosome rescue protein Dom34